MNYFEELREAKKTSSLLEEEAFSLNNEIDILEEKLKSMKKRKDELFGNSNNSVVSYSKSYGLIVQAKRFNLHIVNPIYKEIFRVVLNQSYDTNEKNDIIGLIKKDDTRTINFSSIKNIAFYSKKTGKRLKSGDQSEDFPMKIELNEIQDLLKMREEGLKIIEGKNI